MKLKKLTASCSLAFLLLAPNLASAKTFGYEIGRANRSSTQILNEAEKDIKNTINQSEKSIVKGINDSTDRIVAALQIATAQEAIASNQVAEADRNARQVAVSAYAADKTSEAIMEATLKFSPKTGQGFAACKVMAENGRLAQVMDTVDRQAGVKVKETDNSPLAMASSVDQAFKSRTEVHNENFCTEAEGSRGVCKPTEESMQGADSNAATLFVSAPKDSKIADAKRSVRQNILGSPTVAIPKRSAETAEGQAYLYATNHKTALSAFPAYSLAYLESMSEVRDDIKDADGNPLSPNDMLLNTVARYYGGKDSVEWQKSMINQQPRGLLVELAKMEGLGAWMDYQGYLARQRMEGNIAAMTLTAALPIEDRMNKQRVRSVSQASKSNIVSGAK